MENHQDWLDNQIATYYGFANGVLLRAGFFGLIESDICKTDKYDDPHLYISSKDNRDGWRKLEEYLNLTIQGQLLRVRTEVNSPSQVGQYEIKKLLDEVNFFDPFQQFLATLTAREAHVLTSDRTSLPYDYFAGAW